MTKIIVTAAVLQEILAKHPEVEVDLIKNGAAQVAERLRHRIMESTGESIVSKTIDRINRELNSRYNMPPAVMKMIESVVTEQIKRYNVNEAEKLARQLFADAFAKQASLLEAKLDRIATTLVEKKIAAVFAQAARMK